MDALRIEEFVARDSPSAGFESLREGLYAAPDPEPVAPGTRCLLASRGAEPVARLSLARIPEHRGPRESCFALGHFEAADPAAGVALLRRAQATLSGDGAVTLLGPMNGNTWERYRLALPPAEDELPEVPPFMGEPWNPPGYAVQFEQAGFRPVSVYESRLVAARDCPREGADRLARRVAAGGVRVRGVNPDRLEDELRGLFRLSTAAFAPARYYQPIDFATFRRLYAGRRTADPQHVLLAEDGEGRLLAFVFAYPDRDAGDGHRRLVVKTLACAPEAQARGLGAFLADRIHAHAWEQGFDQVIHALMHSRNPSVCLSERFGGRVFRRYAVFAWSAGA